MPAPLTYPGVYIEEVQSGVRTITGVATSITAFIGRTLRGPVNTPVRVQSYSEFDRRFGGLWTESTLAYAVAQFFLNGGGDALIVRVVRGTTATPATLTYGVFTFEAGEFGDANPGDWGNRLRIRVESVPSKAKLFNLTVRDTGTGLTERFLNLSTESTSSRYVKQVLAQQSALIRMPADLAAPPGAPNAPQAHDDGAGKDVWADNATSTPFTAGTGSDGDPIKDDDISDQALTIGKKGLWALEKADIFNLLCIPPLEPDKDLILATREAAASYCKSRRAFFIVDPLRSWTTPALAATGIDAQGANSFMTRSENAAVFFPHMKALDPLRENRVGSFAPCGAVAGTFARTDATRGIWKAPAGIDATLSGAVGLDVGLTDGENGQLNPLGINCLRSFPVIGRVVWGSRTLRGADQLASEWKYISVRRLALFLEESLYRGTQWVVFEPNDEPLWAQIRLNVGAFMQNLFRQGAFQGRSPREAYFVKCDRETTTQNHINLGIVNILVGFAPLKPAEFVVIKVQQMAGQVEA